MSFKSGFLEHGPSAIMGATIGTILADAGAGILNIRDMENLSKLPGKENTHDTVRRLKESIPQGTEIITSRDLKKKLKQKDLGFFKRLKHTILLQGIKDSGNAFADIADKKLYLPEKTHEAIVAHEIGHLRDYPKGYPVKDRLRRAFGGHLTGFTHEQEERAWDEAPVGRDSSEIKDLALGTYKRTRNWGRVGLGVGAASGLALSLLASRAAR